MYGDGSPSWQQCFLFEIHSPFCFIGQSEIQCRKSQKYFHFSLVYAAWMRDRIVSIQFWHLFSFQTEMNIIKEWCLTIVVSVSPSCSHGCCYLIREQPKILNPQNQKNLRRLMLFIVEWRLLFAISQFWRLKFEGNPLVDYKWKLIFKVLNDFTQRLSLQKSRVTLKIT